MQGLPERDSAPARSVAQAPRLFRTGGGTIFSLAQDYRPQVHYYSERLQSRLRRIGTFRTTFVEAPSGAGKTTAAQDFFTQEEGKGVLVRWFVASEEPCTSGWLRLCRELSAIDPEAGSRLLRLGFPVEENQGEIAQALMELHCDEATYLVCDNFQFLQKSLPPSVWRALVDHGGKRLKIVILTQQLSSRGLAVLSNADVLRIENEDFCLRAEEIGQYYRLAGVELDREQMESLQRYSEGWMAALYLQLENFIRNGSFERKAGIFELVNDLIWRNLSGEEREALFRLAPFDSFTVPQASFLLDVDVLPQSLSERLHHGPLVRYDIASRRFYPHAIFLDFVRTALHDEPDSLRRESLHRAGRWCAAQGEKTRALDFFYRLRDYRAILSLDLRCADLSRAILDKSLEEMLSLLRDVVDNATPELRRDHAFTFISIAFEAFTLGDMALYGRVCGEMKGLLEKADMDEGRRRSLLGELHLAISFGAYNDIEEMGKSHQRAAELLGTTSSLFEPGSPWTFGWPSVLGMYHGGPGRLEIETEQMDYWLPRYNVLTSGNGSGADLLFRAEALFHRGRDEEAEPLALKALDVTRRCGQDSLCICTAFLLQRISLLRGDGPSRDASLSLMENCARHSRYALSRRIADMATGFTAVLLDDPDGVPAWLRGGHFLKTLSPAVPFAFMIYGRLLLLTGREREMLLRSEEFLFVARRYGSLLAEIYVTLDIAVAQSRLDRERDGVDTLCRALDLALPDGLVLPFAENADLLGPLLDKALSGRETVGHRDLLALRERYARGRERLLSGLPGKEELPGGLTPREYEVARRVLEGKSNGEIAAELFLSENTVKYHLKAVFQKLGIRSRRDVKKALSKDYP